MRAQRQASLSRRDLLKGMGGAIAGLALAGPLDLRGAVRAVAAGAPRIAIIGGGTAGLNAALTLQDAGYASTVGQPARWPHAP